MRIGGKSSWRNGYVKMVQMILAETGADVFGEIHGDIGDDTRHNAGMRGLDEEFFFGDRWRY